jgi:short-subunit dehydrogenase
LINQTVWITGASSGIGAAVVCELAKAQAQHVILSARRVEHMKQVVANCQEQQQQLLATTPLGSSYTTTTFSIVPYDALIPEQTSEVVQQAIASTPNNSIDILILNSGIYQVEPALQTSYDNRRKLFQVNVESPIELSQALIRQDGWKERGHGHIVVVSSMMSKGPQSLCSTYAATKAAIKTYFDSLSTEEWTWLRVTNVLPGATATSMWDHVVVADNDEDVNRRGVDQKVQPDWGGCMSATRVAQLMVRGISTSSLVLRGMLYELWITKPVGLVYGYMAHYTPMLFHYANHLVAPARIHAWKEYQMDMLELPALLRTMYQLLMAKYF